MKFSIRSFRAESGDRKPKDKNTLRLHLGAFFLLVTAFIAALLSFFPTEALRLRAEQMIRRQTGESVSIGQLSLRPLLSLQLADVKWSPAAEPWPPVNIPQVKLSPRWSALVTAQPGLNFTTHLSDGSIEGSFIAGADTQAEIISASIAPYFPGEMDYKAQGILSGTFSSDGDPSAESTESVFDLQLEQAAVTGLERLGISRDRLSLGTIRIQGKLQGRNLKIENLSAAGGELQIDGKATILVATTPQQSRINAQIAMTPGSNLDPGLRDLLTLSGVTPDRNGTFNFRLSGSLAQPNLR
jgi:type II secretion system protein N